MTNADHVQAVRTAAAGIIASGVRASRANRLGGDAVQAEADTTFQASSLLEIETGPEAIAMVANVAGALIDRLAELAGVDPTVLLQQYSLGSESGEK